MQCYLSPTRTSTFQSRIGEAISSVNSSVNQVPLVLNLLATKSYFSFLFAYINLAPIDLVNSIYTYLPYEYMSLLDWCAVFPRPRLAIKKTNTIQFFFCSSRQVRYKVFNIFKHSNV